MRSRIINAPKLIAAFGLGEAKLTALADVCVREGIMLREVLPHEADCTVGFLCGFKGFAPAKDCETPPETECLIFSGFDRRTLSETVDKLRGQGAAVALKAVCTPSNQSWTLRALLEELAKEHEYMTRGGGAK